MTTDAACDILLIEDSPSQALRFQLLLSRAGYRVRIARDGIEGWRCACDERPRLILLDVDLPLMSGFQVLARLKRGRSTADIPVVMLTNREHVSDVISALDTGADDYLPKRDALTQICSVIAQHLV
ncbi:MAG TPA: response regulator [Roseiflexaceae bacterium]|nr:response regulator [Roseiflexaceae bacterium]